MGCHEFTMQTLVHKQQQADDIRRNGNSKDSSQAEQERFHETGDSEIDGTNAELQKADTELAEDQAAIDNRQQLTGDACPASYNLTTLRIVYINVHQEKIAYQNIYCWMIISRFLPFQTYSHMGLEAINVKTDL